MQLGAFEEGPYGSAGDDWIRWPGLESVGLVEADVLTEYSDLCLLGPAICQVYFPSIGIQCLSTHLPCWLACVRIQFRGVHWL